MIWERSPSQFSQCGDRFFYNIGVLVTLWGFDRVFHLFLVSDLENPVGVKGL